MNKIVCFVDESELYLYLDSELPANRQEALREHVSICLECRVRFETVQNLKDIMHKACGNVKAPSFLKDQIITSLENSPSNGLLGFWGICRDMISARPLLPIGMAMLLVGAFFIFMLMGPSPTGAAKLVSDMVHEHDEYIEGFKSANGIESADPKIIEQWIASNSEMRVDLALCDKLPSLAGACQINEDGRDVTCLFFDKGQSRVSLFMLRLDKNEMPKSRATIVNGMPIYSGQTDRNNYLLWSNSDYSYLLVSKLPKESLISMAQSLAWAGQDLSVSN